MQDLTVLLNLQLRPRPSGLGRARLEIIQPTCLPVRYQEGVSHENCVIC